MASANGGGLPIIVLVVAAMGEAAGMEARGYTWAAFEQDNLAARTHGARSRRLVEPIAREIAAELVAIAPWVGQPAFAAEVTAWAHAEARCRLMRAWLDANGLWDDNGEPRSTLSMLDRAEARAAALRANLGLNPAAWAKLLASLTTASATEPAKGLDELRAVGRAILEAGEVKP